MSNYFRMSLLISLLATIFYGVVVWYGLRYSLNTCKSKTVFWKVNRWPVGVTSMTPEFRLKLIQIMAVLGLHGYSCPDSQTGELHAQKN